MGDSELEAAARIRAALPALRNLASGFSTPAKVGVLAIFDDVETLLDEAAARDRLEAAARAVVERWELGMTIEEHEIDALAAALAQPPVPLQRDDTVTRDDADRVPVGAILRSPDGCPWHVDEPLWARCGGGDVAHPDRLADSYWPMTVLWLPEPSDAEAGS